MKFNTKDSYNFIFTILLLTKQKNIPLRSIILTLMATKRKILVKGVRFLAFALPLLFAGPIIIQSSFRNQNNPLFYLVLLMGILCCGFGMYFIFKGITTVVKSFFYD